LYTGGKTGCIKVWSVVDEKLKLMGDLIGHNKAVNGLTDIGVSSSKELASAGDDKRIRIWKYFE